MSMIFLYAIQEVIVMPKLHYFMYADAIFMEGINHPSTNVELEPKMHIVAPILFFNPEYVPGLYSFSVACGLLEINTTKDHTVRLVFTKEGENETLVETGELPVVLANPDGKNDSSGALLFSIDFRNVALKSIGNYKTDVFIDKELIGSCPIEVRKKE
jgi:hypothetical protein